MKLNLKSIRLIIMLLLLCDPLSAQIETIISDGVFGLSYDFEEDTVVIENVARSEAAERAGIHKGDKIIYINSRKVSGAGLRYGELDSYMSASAGTEMSLKILREGVDSLISCSVILDFSREVNTSYCYYDYVVDRINELSAAQIFSDSVGNNFCSLIENGISVYSLDQDSTAGLLDIKPGDKFLSFNIGTDSWAKFMFKEYLDHDTIIRILRDSTEFDLHADLRKYPELKINSIVGQDFKEESLWLRMIFTKYLIEDKTVLVRFEPYDSIILYQRGFDGTILKKMTGTAILDQNRDPFYKNWPVIRMNLRKELNDTVYIRISQTGGIFFPPSVDILSYDYIVQFEQIERLILGAMLGIMLIIIIYYFILYIFLKDKSYLVYLLFIISLSFTLLHLSGYGPQFVWPNSISFFNDIEILFLTIPLTFLLIFDSIYLDIKRALRGWYKIGKILLIILWVVTSLILVDSLANDTIMWSAFEGLLAGFIGICLVALVVIVFSTVILRIRQSYKPAWFFLYGITILFLSIIIFLQSNSLTGFLSRSFNMSVELSAILLRASIYLGAIAQFLIFAVGLGKKMRDSGREIKLAQETLIGQLKENEKLKDKVNLELEQKVKERTREIESQKDELLEQQREITDSINYAKRIQTAALPPEGLLKEILPEHFVLFKPKDIVSGDFYWLRQVKNFIVVVAADCTGHGVPGAFMSMLGMSLLNEQVSSRRFDSAGEILNRLRRKVKETLSQEGKNLEQKDGMDLALAIIDNESLEIQFAGAFNPLYIIRKTGDKRSISKDHRIIESNGFSLIEIKGDRQPIAIHSFEKDFTTNIFQLQPEDTLYLFSDGYQDQFGGPENKKFMTKKFKKLLLEIQGNDLNEQKEILAKTLTDWQGNNQQIDDIIVFGIRWS